MEEQPSNQTNELLTETPAPLVVEEKKESYGLELLKIFIIAAALILPLRFILFEPFYVKGSSMEPNFYENEYLVIDRVSPLVQSYSRGEVIVFRYPANEKRYLIKRIIGLPGERVEIHKRKITIFNKAHPKGLALDEKEYAPRQLRDQDVDRELLENEYFVLGDNRPVSMDSEYFGPIEKDQITGRVLIRAWPFNRAAIIPIPQY